MRSMGLDDMFAAMQELAEPGEVTVLRRLDRNAIDGNTRPWFVRLYGVEILDGCVLRGVGGDGASPEEAIAGAWRSLTALKAHEYLVVGAMTPERRAYRWNGSRWVPVNGLA